MKMVIKSLVLFCLMTVSAMAAENYLPNSGDKELDASLQLINQNYTRKNKKKLSHFVSVIAQEFQIPMSKVEELYNHYEMNSADVLMSISIADVSGEPLSSISGIYFKNKTKGWKYTLNRMNIMQGSITFNQIKKDMAAEY